MKTNTFKLLSSLYVATLFWPSAYPASAAEAPDDTPSMQRIGREMNDTARAIGDYSAQKGNEAADTVKSGFNDLKSQTTEQWNRVDQATHEKSREALEAMGKQRDEAAIQADRLKDGSQDAWGHVKKGFSDAYSSFRQAWEKPGKENGSGK